MSGRSRRTLFHVRTPGALAVVLPFVAIASPRVAGSYAFAGGGVTESAYQVALYGASTAALIIVTTVLGVALGSIVPARVATGALIGWNAVLASILASIPSLGSHAADRRRRRRALGALARRQDGRRDGGHHRPRRADRLDRVSLKAGSYWTERVDA